MSQKFIVLSLTLVACAVVYVTAYPAPRAIELEKALNHTVCPIRVVIDEDPERIPRRIKTLRCGQDPHQWCLQHHVPRVGCCLKSNDDHVMECVEVHDKVIVKYPNRKDNQLASYDVPVGCTCLVSKANEASEFAPPT
ncbi:hypothetical protein NE865_03863 [Phthorimaea operculella]|nr:hypothetical protein NE865_03863 [Phthorimaea operculella]